MLISNPVLMIAMIVSWFLGIYGGILTIIIFFKVRKILSQQYAAWIQGMRSFSRTKKDVKKEKVASRGKRVTNNVAKRKLITRHLVVGLFSSNVVTEELMVESGREIEEARAEKLKRQKRNYRLSFF